MKNNTVLISSRIRLARNFANMRFIPAMTEEEKENLKEKIHEKLKKNNPFSLDYINMESLDPVHAGALIEEHLISPDFNGNKKGEALLINHGEKISIMVNEEDHLRIQVLGNDGNLEELYSKAKALDEYFDGMMPFAFSEKLGYLTCCPTNLGTGLRASIMVHLPALTECGQIDNIAASFSNIGLTVRGIYGEGSQPSGCVYQISNSVSLGVSEKEIIKLLEKALSQLEASEKKLREKLVRRPGVEDRMFRRYGLLKEARMISSKEATEYLSDLRMGACEKIFDIPADKIDELSVKIQPYNIMLVEGEKADGAARDRKRAEILRNALSGN